MEYRLKASNNRSLAISIVILLLIAILALGVCFRLIKVNQQLTEDLVNNRQIIIQPLGANKEFAFSGAKGDARYLRLIALSFLNLRLNVSKETVQANHDLLLAYACEGQRKVMLPVLAEEKKRITLTEGSSVFYPQVLRVAADTGLVDITGDLVFTYGMKSLDPLPKHYQIRMDTRNDGLCYNAFVEVPVEN